MVLLKMWDAANGQGLILTCEGRSGSPNQWAVAWSPDGRSLASASRDSTVQVWDAASGTALLTFTGHSDSVRAVVWSPDGRRVAAAI